MGGNSTLVKDNRAFGVDPSGNQTGSDFARIRSQLGGVLWHGDGMQVDYAINAIEILLRLNPVLDRAKVIAEMQIPGRLYTREDSFHDAKLRAGCKTVVM